MQKKAFPIDPKIYKPKYIQEAISAFEDYSIEYANNTLIIGAEDDDEIILIFREFMNYIVFLQTKR
ncbi:hypothetical protein MK079_03630 [Candidatus Gracilibacteria bacterium]|nr:hypothetical protein [Candidatus Gracilibacteria bacterium]